MVWPVIPMEENLGDGSLILFLTFSHTSSLHKEAVSKVHFEPSSNLTH